VRLHGEDGRRPELVGVLDLDKSLTENVGLVAEAKGKDVGDVVAIVLDRPRHQEGIEEIRAAGGRVRLISDGDVSAAMLAASENAPVDLLWGVGGTPRASSPPPRSSASAAG
jgi:fructose-1,6-bisphosphatase II